MVIYAAREHVHNAWSFPLLELLLGPVKKEQKQPQSSAFTHFTFKHNQVTNCLDSDEFLLCKLRKIVTTFKTQKNVLFIGT